MYNLKQLPRPNNTFEITRQSTMVQYQISNYLVANYINFYLFECADIYEIMSTCRSNVGSFVRKLVLHAGKGEPNHAKGTKVNKHETLTLCKLG